MSITPTVIIVGAGASGIAAATRLSENGIDNITILEAEDRIGGRIHSVEFCGKVIDLGGQWCHGEKDNIVYELVKDLNLLDTSHNTYQDNTYYLSDGTVLDKELTDRIFVLAGEIFEDEECASKNPGTYGDHFIEEYNKHIKIKFESNEKAKKIASGLLDWFHKFFNGLDSTKTWFDVSNTGPFNYKQCEGDLQWNWKDRGYKIILDVLMKKIPDPSQKLQIEEKIRLNKEVTKIIWDSDTVSGVTVECSDQSSYNADHVIVTVSLGVLKNFQRNFVPELPLNKQKAIEAMAIGTVNKILLKFPNKWWGDDSKGFSFIWTDEDSKELIKEFPHGPSDNGKSWLEQIYGFYVIDSHPQVLLGWVVGTMADQVELLSDDVVMKGCMHLLNKFVGKLFKIEQPDAILRSKWKSNPHFLGSYSYRSIQSEKENVSGLDLAQPLISNSSKQTVLFAGEATHPYFYSTVHGAIETGHREADRLLKIYKPKSSPYRKVAIVGAGMAGLGAATALLEYGFDDFVIIEAQDRPGGRIHTLELDGHIIELGAQWIHGQDNPLFELARKHDLISPQTSEEGLGSYIRENGEIIDESLVKLVDFQVGKILSECEKFANSLDYPQSVGDFLRVKFEDYMNKCADSIAIREVKNELLEWHIRFQIIDNSCLNLHNLSAKSWGLYRCDEEEKTHINLRRGYGELVAVIIDKLPKNSLLLSTPIREIQYGCKSSEPVQLICVDGSVIICDHVIMTASLGVLKNNFIFNPPLPYEITQTINDLGFYAIGKIFLIFNYKWWDVEAFQFIWGKDSALIGSSGCEGSEEEWVRFITGFDQLLNEPNILLGWVGGSGVAAMEGLSEENVGRHCMNLIRRFVRGREIPDPVRIVRTKWFSNCWMKGSYCHITPACDHSGSEIHNLSQPVFVDSKLRILLAGEANHTSHFSTTHGAYESGQHQAKLLFEYISNKCTSSKL